MTKSDLIGPTVMVGIFGAVAAIVMGIGYAIDSSEAPVRCYSDLKSTYSWQHRVPELDEIWADRKITNGECSLIGEIYKDVETEQKRREVDDMSKQVHA